MTNLLTEIRVMLPGGARELQFKTTRDVARWADSERSFWSDVDVQHINGHLSQQWQQQVGFFAGIASILQEYERRIEQNQEGEARQFNDNLRSHFNRLVNGEIISSDHEYYPAIRDMARTSPRVAAMLLVAAKNDADSVLGNFGQYGLPFSLVVRLILQYGRSKGSRDWLQPQRKELTSLKDDFQGGLNELRSSLDEQGEAITQQREAEKQAHSDRDNEWVALKERMGSEWDALKRVYDEQLALLAPTQYWTDRATSHKKVAVLFAASFGALLTGFVALFSWLAMPRLFELASQKDISPILTLVPVGVLAFAGIWVLKMLSRLLSENLQMMRDARERETMVKTFLALMRDDKDGKSIVNDNDRILILHSLFRPSSVSAIDDAPPVHWFDILTNKVSGKGGTKS